MHVLSAPPAFILSQDRTLRSKLLRLLAGVLALSTSVRPWPYDPLIFGFTKKHLEFPLRNRLPETSAPGRNNFASLSSSISSIAVSGFQGSPRGSAAQGVTIRPAGPPGAGNRRLHDFHTSRPRGPAHGGGARRRGAAGPLPAKKRKMPSVGQRRPALPRTRSAVPSALGGLTSGFGMGPGVPPLPWSLTSVGHSSPPGPCPGGRTARPVPDDPSPQRPLRDEAR